MPRKKKLRHQNNAHVEVFSARLKLESRSYSEKKIKPVANVLDEYATNSKIRLKAYSRHLFNPNILPQISDRSKSNQSSPRQDLGRFDRVYNKRITSDHDLISPLKRVRSHRGSLLSDRSSESHQSPIPVYQIGRRDSPTNQTSPLNTIDRKESLVSSRDC